MDGRKKAEIAEKLYLEKDLPDEELKRLLQCADFDDALFFYADRARRTYYGTDVYIRGLIEISSYCKNDCYYCGIRKSNRNAVRYRLDEEAILSCCAQGYRLGFRTFVLQGGEDGFYTDDKMCRIVQKICGAYPDCAITLSLGERPRESYQKFFDAGANRYLLRHETADEAHYKKLHPSSMSLRERKQCLWDLKEIGYQTGSGFMVGSPFQTAENLLEDLRFLQELRPDMIGIGPFVPHKDTVFADQPGGELKLTLRLLAVLRLMFPYALIPATTALGTIHPRGRELGLLAGANVVMPNLSPASVRGFYNLYDRKICTGEEAAEGIGSLKKRVESVGFHIVTSRGDVAKYMETGVCSGQL